MLYIKAFHIISMVCWFAGLFYLPRLFVYHTDAKDTVSNNRFKIMEKRLYYGIIWPSAVLTTAFGNWLSCYNIGYYVSAGWMHAKIALVLLLWIYQLASGHCLKQFARDANRKSSFFYRVFNEIPIVLLLSIVLLVVLKPF